MFSLAMSLSALTLIAAVAPTLADSAPRSFRLVDGDVQVVIVGNDDMNACRENSYRNTPAFLRSYIERSTGRALRQVREADYDPATMPSAIFLGDTQAARSRHAQRLATLDRDAYVVEVTPTAVYLIGARPHSTDYAMADFLESALGIATYIPAKWGTIVPRHTRVALEPALRVEVPAFHSRALGCLRTHLDVEKLNHGANAEIPWPIYRRDTFSHNLHTFITVEEFGKTHPEYFPEVNGKRTIVSTGAGPGPCISNPQVVQIITQKVLAWFADPKNADADIISLGMTDGGWCECAACQAHDGPDINGQESKSRRYYTFLNQVAAELARQRPGKSIGVLGYAGADWPPADLQIARNIVPYICQTRANWGDPAVKALHLRQTQAWSSRVDRIGVYEYLYGAGFMVPRLYHQHLADYLRTVRAGGDAGFYAEIYSNHALDGPKAWVTQKLLWNPQLDPQALQRLWCQRVFEEAADPMNAYFAFLEQCNHANVLRCPQGRKERDSKFYMLQDEIQFNLFNAEETDRAAALLEQARATTQRPELLERIAYFQRGLEVASLSVKSYHAFNDAKALAAAGGGDRELLAALIRGEAGMPSRDPILLMQEAVAIDASSFTPVMPVAVSTATELSMKLVNGRPWSRVHELLLQGVGDRGALVTAAQEAIGQLAPSGWEQDLLAARRVNTLLAMCRRIAVARRLPESVATPQIDGKTDDAAWTWQQDQPWWQWKSGIDYTEPAEVAFCHRGQVLYVAYRCSQPGLDEARTVEGDGAPAWKVIGMELHLDQDARDAAGQTPVHFLAIVGLGGGMYANPRELVQAWGVTHTATQWQGELALDLGKLPWGPGAVKAVRMNMIRNSGPNGHYGKGWFPSSHAHKDREARGWLVLEP